MHAAAAADRAFHVLRSARDHYAIPDGLIGLRGDLVVADLLAIRALADRMRADRPGGEPAALAGEIVALGLLHEVGHLLVRQHERDRPGAMDRLLDTLRADPTTGVDVVLDRFGEAFPGRTDVPEPAVVRLEELLLTRVANENPAIGPLRVLIDDAVLSADARYPAVIAGIEADVAAGPTIQGPAASLIERMREPARAAPTSLVGQLRFVRERWGDLVSLGGLEDLIGRLEVAIGVLAEEELALHRRFGGGAGDGRRDVHPPSFTTTAAEPEAFSVDSAWMPQVVLMAKSTYVWLEQLSRRYGRDIRTLDAIPDEELDTLARWGVTGLWLIGLWQRSVASERIKRMRGNHDAVASAYALDDYRIADDLGGESAHANLRERAWARGIRLASDMVPNHMGIDSRWVIEHPEWFLSVPVPPYPGYRFSGADLSPDERVGVVLEDHYWDGSDAAVVFKRFDRGGGEDRYVYHGNDGTSFPWNDTAQLDFLRADVREQVIRTIIDVARRFPIIRFDAAMVLARRHIQRLWWPLPGAADAIPSRAAHALPQAEFDARMPHEFWREVVDRVAAEVPGTLLLAEAFWMLEGYFVRTLGMHRVYNSAFMHMLRDEDGAGYRRLIQETLEFDPAILERYVNFMSNPDEETAIEQFGSGDKYVGVATVMATMPGLPMLGHGQIEGFSEKYGMEFRRATRDEQPDPWLLGRHERELFPLFHRRSWFASAAGFRLYPFMTDDGAVDEHVLAYSNGEGPSRSLVVQHLRFAKTTGTIRLSSPVAHKGPDGSRSLGTRSLADGLGLPGDPSAFVVLRDARTGLEHLHPCADLHAHGLRLTLEAYQGHVFWELREVADGVAGQWGRLAERLGGRGVPSVDDALRELQLEPVHGPLRAVLEGGALGVEGRLVSFYEAIALATGVDGDPDALAREVAARSEAIDPDDGEGRDAWPWLVLEPMGRLAPGADPVATSAAWYDELRLATVVAGAGSDADLVRTLLRLPRPSGVAGRGAARDRRLLARWLADADIRAALGVNTWEGVEYLDGDRLADLARWAARLDEVAGHHADQALPDRLATLARTADYCVDRLVDRPSTEKTRTGVRRDMTL